MADNASYSGRLQGFIRPPPDVKAIVDKTADFVAKNGVEYEKKILSQTAESASGKFGFLRPENPYHAYYRHRIAELKDGKSSDTTQPKASNVADTTPATDNAPAAAPVSAPTTQSVEVRRSAGLIHPLSKALRSLSSPPPSSTGSDAPSTSAAIGTVGTLGTVNTVVTSTGMGAVPKDEYTVVLPPTYFALRQSSLAAVDLDTLRLTAQFTAVNGKSFLSQLTQREFRNAAFDFLKPTHLLFPYFTATVEAYSRVLHPTAAVKTTLAADALCSDGIFMRCVVRMESKRLEEERRGNDENTALTGTVMIDWQDFTIVETIAFADDDDKDLPMPQTHAHATKAHIIDDEHIKVRTDYVPLLPSAAAQRPAATFMDPRTGREIPLESAADQVRVELLDPRYKQQQQTYLSRRAETSYVGGEEVAENLKRLAAKRVDIFADRPADSEEPAAKRARLTRNDESAPGT